jgi:type IV pilus assembly protein PilC
MPSFKYVAKDNQGKDITGTIEAENRALVIETLRKSELTIISIEEQKGRLKEAASRKRIKLDDLVVFSRQLATMVDSGIPLVQALDVLSEQIEKQTLRQIVVKVRSDIETGSSLSEALSKHPAVFSNLYVNMVRAGETSGMLDEILDRLALYLEKVNTLQRKVRASLVYPIVVTVMAILITAVLLLKVIPTFKGIFDLLGGTLPLPTQILIGISDFTRQYFPVAVAMLALAGYALRRFIRTEKGRRRFDACILRLPVFGPLLRKVAVAKFTRTLSTLVKSGVPILTSLDIVGKTSGNKVIEEAVVKVRSSIRDGESIAEPLANSGVFPPMVVRMVAVGEKTGELEKMLSKIADFYDEQVDAAVSGLTSMIEPLIIAFLGIVIGAIVIAMFMPIFKLTEVVGAR